MKPLHRRHALALIGSTTLAAPALAQPRTPVVVLTAYPEEVTSRFEAAFEKAHPGYRLQLVWRMPADALPYLQAADQGGVDVYWSASPRTFAALKRGGAFRTLDIDRTGLPARIGGTDISDADGRYLATEVAGYGWALSPARMVARGLARPNDWPDLAEAAWAGEIAMPIPSRVGFAPVMVDIVLQAFGWDQGWALWSAIAANAALVDSGSTFVTDEVASGRRAAGLTIDFFAAAAAAKGAALQFAYPRHGGINPAHIAILARAPHPEGARAFVQFVLSQAGQSLLLHPTIRKLPVRPAAYAGASREQFNPFDAAQSGCCDYDNARGQPRLALVSALFEQAFVADHGAHADAWRRLHAAAAAGRDVARARTLLQAAPLPEAAAADPALAARFRRLEGSGPASTSDVEAAWLDAARQRRQQALAALG